MSNAIFPKNFLWGSATAAHQVEGLNVNSDSWVEEYIEGSPFVEPSGDAIDHYHRYREDIKLLKELGLNSYRFSIEWARIEPEEGFFSKAAMQHYRDVLEACHENGLTPLVTMHHFTSPRWLIKKGGWASEQTPTYFKRYCEKVMVELGELIPYAVTINELNLPINLREIMVNSKSVPPVGVDKSTWEAPDWKKKASRLFGLENDDYVGFLMASSPEYVEILKQAHVQGREAIKKVSPQTKVGVTLALPDVQSIPGGENIAEEMWETYFRQFLPMIEGDDYFGLQNYTREQYSENGRVDPPEGARLTQMGYENYPVALANVVRTVAKDLSIPIIITEHGIATDDDQEREEFIKQGIHELSRCIQEGIDVQGYVYWSAFDNFEWMLGYGKRFGIIAVDRETMKRKAKGSAYLLGEIAQSNGKTHQAESTSSQR